MRRISPAFLASLSDGHLRPLLDAVCQDYDLDLEIRDGYIDVYYKGSTILNLREMPRCFAVAIDAAYQDGLILAKQMDDISTAQCWVDALPTLKRNVIAYGSATGPKSIETEYEQLIIRANNRGPSNVNTEYIIVDRQYSRAEGRFDLTAICWPRNGRQRNRIADLCLIEVKYGLNNDIKDVDKQLETYYDAISANAATYAHECEILLHQKLALGLIRGSVENLAAMAELTVSPNPSRFQYILALIDYNPHSRLLNLAKLRALPFADQLRVLKTGFALWQQDLRSVATFELD